MFSEDGGRDARFAELYARAQAARAHSRALVPRVRATSASIEAEWGRLQAAWEQAGRIWQRRMAPGDPGLLRYSAYARLQARLASMPVIEQAKGIMMAHSGWPADRAFEALRRASQRENVKLRVLAERIVASTTAAGATGQPGLRHGRHTCAGRQEDTGPGTVTPVLWRAGIDRSAAQGQRAE